MANNNNKRRKRSEREILNREALYEKYIPHISQDFAKIIDKSRNNEFKQRCQHLFKVHDSSKIQEAIAAKLFKLTLGDQHHVTMSRTQSIQESRGQRTDIQSCFGDLAYHIDDEQWPTFEQNSSLPPDKMADVIVNASYSVTQNTDVLLQPKEGNNVNDPTVRNSNLTDAATCVTADDDNFNSLELHAMLDVSSWDETATNYSDQRVPRARTNCDIERIHQYYEPLIQESGTSGKGCASLDSDDTHFETLGNLF